MAHCEVCFCVIRAKTSSRTPKACELCNEFFQRCLVSVQQKPGLLFYCHCSGQRFPVPVSNCECCWLEQCCAFAVLVQSTDSVGYRDLPFGFVPLPHGQVVGGEINWAKRKALETDAIRKNNRPRFQTMVPVSDIDAVLTSNYKMTPEEEAALSALLDCQSSFWIPSGGNLQPHSPETICATIEHFIRICVKNIVTFANCIPGFRNLSREDKVVLMERSVLEILIIRLSTAYLPLSDSLTLFNGLFVNRAAYKRFARCDYADKLFDFWRYSRLCPYINRELCALIQANTIFKSTVAIKDVSAVADLNSFYLGFLQRFMDGMNQSSKEVINSIAASLKDVECVAQEWRELILQSPENFLKL